MKRLAYYTDYFGGDHNYSNLLPPLPSDTTDCYFFTNNPTMYTRLEGTKWRRVWMDHIPIHNNSLLDTAATKELRACPHRFPVLDAYEYLCWFDTKLKVYEEVVERCVGVLASSDKVLAMTRHPYSDRYKTVWDEYHTAMTVEKYRAQQEQTKAFLERRLAAGASDVIDVFYCGGFRLIKRCAKANELNELWYKYIVECGIEDQISFQFVQQIYADAIHGLAYQESWKYFYE